MPHNPIGPQTVNLVFKEPIYRVLEKIKNEPYFKWPNRMGGDPIKRNQNLYCQYHQDRGHTIEDCRTLQAFLDQLIKASKLKQFLQQPASQGGQPEVGTQRSGASQSSLGTINVIFASTRKDSISVSRVMMVSSQIKGNEGEAPLKKPRISDQPILGFFKEDKEGTIQLHDNALVVTL